MKRKLILLTATAILLSSAANSTDVIIEDTPNVGDTTTITTVTTGNPVTTNNLVSQDWVDGSWVGDMFPDSSDINENTWLTGKDGKYAETTLNSEDYVSIEEMQQGFTSNFGAQIRWWNNVESTVTMTQSISNGIDTTTQSTTFEDTTNSSYQVNPYGNVLIMSPDPDMTHGTATYRFDFDIINDNQAGYNGGHAGVDVRDPTVVIDYTALSSTTVTTIEYCWQKNPPTCPGQDEIEDVQEQLEQFEMIEFTIPEDIFMEPPPEIEYSFNPVFEEEIEIVEEFNILAVDEFFFEDDYYEDVIVEEYIPMDVVAIEDLDWNDSKVEFFDELPPLEMFEELPPMEEVYMEDIVMEEMFAEEFTEEMQEEFIEEVFEVYEEVVVEAEPEPAPEPEIVEEVAMVEEKPAMEEVKEEPIEEEIVDEEISEQPSSEEVVADEPAPAAEIAQQEEAVQEPAQEQPNSDVEVDLDIKVAAIEKAIQNKIKNEMQRVSVTLDVINEIVSREMTSTQADISSYFDTNAALFDTRQIPGGDPSFFLQASLASYDKTIYATQASIAGTDPVVKHQMKMQEYKKTTSDAYRNLMELLNARNVQ
jgi:opacity protein-like surface antigen/outer membrane biosynthesis protein TonB